jgi:hypothetical protein
MSWIGRILRWLAGFLPWRERRFRCKRVVDIPEHVRTRRIYVAGENGHAWAAAMLCPCGCKATIHLNLLPDVRPRWICEAHVDGTVTLSPSVCRQKGCRSHFFVRRGCIVWCEDRSDAAVGEGAPVRS